MHSRNASRHEVSMSLVPHQPAKNLSIRQFLQGHVNCKASFAYKRGASQFGLIALIAARNTDADILCIEEHVAPDGPYLIR